MSVAGTALCMPKARTVNALTGRGAAVVSCHVSCRHCQRPGQGLHTWIDLSLKPTQPAECPILSQLSVTRSVAEVWCTFRPAMLTPDPLSQILVTYPLCYAQCCWTSSSTARGTAWPAAAAIARRPWPGCRAALAGGRGGGTAARRRSRRCEMTVIMFAFEDRWHANRTPGNGSGHVMM